MLSPSRWCEADVQRLNRFNFLLFLFDACLYVFVFVEEHMHGGHQGEFASLHDAAEHFWGDVTANIDWCESNYAITFLVCEFWNTVSSLIFVFVGFLGVKLCWDHRIQSRFIVTYLLLAVIGLGSVAFHTTLKFSMQMADELPIIFLLLNFFYIVISMHRTWSYLAQVLFGYALVVCVGMLWMPHQPFMFQFPCYFFTIALLLHQFRLFGQPELGIALRVLLQVGFSFFLVGTLAWPLDRLLCHKLELLQLHAWWHLLSCCGIHCHIQVLQFLSKRALGHDSRLTSVLGLPFYV